MPSHLSARLARAEQAMAQIERHHSHPRGIAELLHSAIARHQRGEAEPPEFLNLADFPLVDQPIVRRINAARVQSGLIPNP